MGFSFETLGNATIQVCQDGKPVFVTDPWLKGTAYYGSWALDHPLDERQIKNAQDSEFVWYSHGHPDHLHTPSLPLLSPNQQFLVSNHYRPEIQDFLKAEGFPKVEVMKFKTWRELKPGLRIMALENDNQDSALLIELGDTLVLNLNDSPLSGEHAFLKKLIKGYRHSYLLALCSFDADMINLIDADGKSLAGPPELKKPGNVLMIGDLCTSLGVDRFCCSSSQHVYARQDSAWANPYRITWFDMEKYWVSEAELIEPFVTVDVDSAEVTRHHPSQESDFSQVRDDCAGDDWDEKATNEEWQQIESFARKFPLLEERLDFLGFVIGGEARQFDLSDRAQSVPTDRIKGIRFHCPKGSLLQALEWGYFDELLIGNFIKTELIIATLYPDFTPIVAKLGGNAKVFTKLELSEFRRHYYRLSRWAYIKNDLQSRWLNTGLPASRRALSWLGIFTLAKKIRRRIFGLPALPSGWRSEELP